MLLLLCLICFLIPSQEIGSEECPRNDLFCVVLDVIIIFLNLVDSLGQLLAVMAVLLRLVHT